MKKLRKFLAVFFSGLALFCIECSQEADEGAPDRSVIEEVKVMTFNVLREWDSNRRSLFEEVISTQNPDILCLQEVEDDGQLQDIEDYLTNIFGFEGYDKALGGNNSEDEKSPIFWKTSKFISSGYSNFKNVGDYQEDEWYCLKNSNENRILNWVQLVHIDSGKYFLVANTHWVNDCGDCCEGATHRIHAANDTISKIKEIIETRNELTLCSPIILAGDFNSHRGSGPYNIINAHFKETSLNSIPRTTVIDFIFYRGLQPPLYEEGVQNGASDHLPVMATFTELIDYPEGCGLCAPPCSTGCKTDSWLPDCM